MDCIWYDLLLHVVEIDGVPGFVDDIIQLEDDGE